MAVIISILVIFYVIGVYILSKKIVFDIRQDNADKIGILEAEYNQLDGKKEVSLKKKLVLEDEAAKIFTLYELTKEITKFLNINEAVETFKKRLRVHVIYEECLFFEVLSEEYKEKTKEGHHYIFTLKHKRKKIGYLAIKGAQEDDHEKIGVLGNQFALALRRIELYQELERIAITDGLTEVNTRRHTLEQLAEEIKRSSARKIKLSFMMIDVDHFKQFNDNYGHITGDKILREIGVIIKDNIREIDIPGRYGGEEFCVILPDTDIQGAQFAAERIKQAAQKAVIKVYDTTVKVTLSIGVCTFPDHAQKIDELIDKADWALYRAKKQGRNRICVFGKYAKE